MVHPKRVYILKDIGILACVGLKLVLRLITCFKGYDSSMVPSWMGLLSPRLISNLKWLGLLNDRGCHHWWSYNHTLVENERLLTKKMTKIRISMTTLVWRSLVANLRSLLHDQNWSFLFWSFIACRLVINLVIYLNQWPIYDHICDQINDHMTS